MFDMLVEQRTTPPGHHTIHHHNHNLAHHHNEMAQDLSPGRSLASSSISMSSKASSTGSNSSETPLKDTSESFEDHPSPSSPKNINIRDNNEGKKNISEDFSALQRLQFALEKNILFSGLFSPESETSDVNDHSGQPKLIKKEPLSSPSFQHHGSSGEDKNGGLGDKSLESPGSISPLIIHSDPSEDPANIFQCPLCSVVCNSRHSFNEHLVIHTQQVVCPKCTFFTDDEEKLNSHIKESHDMTEFETLSDDEEVRNPKVNSQGKVKTFKCKQCPYVTVTKADFWAHSKSHIREEKMLNCPKCPFVTEYKHHLEYHLRNHFNSKPFQCTKCSYTCVNKSMLNSHLKSHSNVYQYRCADCSYATKYCHSLKLHLRKYSHNPSMVLNADGSPNPLPIIDVYGTRRGPKIKKGEPTTASVLAALDAMDGQQLSPNGSLSPPSARNHNNNKIKGENQGNPTSQQQQKVKRKKKVPKQIPSMNANANGGRDVEIPMVMPTNRTLNNNNIHMHHSSASGEDSDYDNDEGMRIRINHQIQPQQQQQLMNGAMRLPNDQPNNPIIDSKNPLQIYAAYLSSINQGYNPYMNSVAQQHFHRQQEFDANQQQQQQQQRIKLLSQLQLMSQAHQAQAQVSQNQVNNLPYNLSTSPNSLKPQPKQQKQQQHPPQLNNRVQQQQDHNSQAPLDLTRASINLPLTNGEDMKKRKRKGKAIKRYDPNNDHIDDDDDDDHWKHEDLDENIVLDFSNNNLSREKFHQSLVQTRDQNQQRIMNNRCGNLSTSPSSSPGQLMTCKYCEISFPDRVLYSMHMSYHSDSNPFLCKSCGKKSDNKTAFFIHLTTDSH